MAISLPPEIMALMTVPVTWEGFLGFDGHAEPSYAPAINLLCWQESHGLTGGGLEAFRNADGTVVEPQYDLYFDGRTKCALQFQMYDRFTPVGAGTLGQQSLQAVRIATFYGPPFDNRNPWIIQVTL